ncbi:hypothetical protein BUALT_Bualt01G0103900 [Buddleja alternifolia]|uniref:SANT domain-containing protein n=1 Tax=Buddleja alternifolia TaxID=168488 RepID=A0AAV6YCZ1_9LAMI|nr:hypothetical protein BUALT_Bualt01G0103900 [Buddleja alternifolia]
MSPEPYGWDRRDFRKHERSGSDPRFGGGGFGGGGGPHRWRDQNHHPPHAPPYHHHHNNHQQNQRWYSDFRSSRPIPPGHGKQGGWHMYPDEGGHGFMPFGSRYGDRNAEEENCRPFGSRSDGRYFRNRENRGSLSQKDWKAPSSEPASSQSCPGRSTPEVNNQRSVENTETCNSNDNNNGDDPSHPLPNSVNPSDQCQSPVKEQHEENVATADLLSGSGQKLEKENSLGSIDWKPLKWTRSGSMSSRGSGFSHSGSSKSMGVDSVEMVVEVHEKSVTPVQSPPPGVATCVVSTAPALAITPSDEIGSRKKPRLGWGEGLAKYEKKKVEGPEDGATEKGLVISSNTETMPSHFLHLLDKSPRLASLTDCASPATPSSVACSSSPGIEEKESVKAATTDHTTTNLSCSPSIMSQTHYEGPTFNLENLERTSIASLSNLINELVQADDPSSVETSYVRTTSMNKLLVLKVDVLKAIEMTESEIDTLETELKSLASEPRSCCLYPAASSSQPGDCHLRPSEEQATASNFTVRPAPLQVVSSGDTIVKNMPAAAEEGHVGSKGEEIDSPGSATSKFVEDTFPPETAECAEGFVNLEADNSSDLEDKCLKNDISGEENTSLLDDCNPVASNCRDVPGVRNVHYDVYDTFQSIYASNKDSWEEASECLNKLLPPQQCLYDTSTASSVSSCRRDSTATKEIYLKRKRSLQFREKVITLKFKVFQHFWKEGRVVSLRKLRVKSHKKFDLSRSGYKKNRSSSRSRISFFVGSSRTVPAEEVIEFVNGLLSESPFKPYRNTLKMPSLILDKGTKMSRFISNNGLVEDPCALEKERSIMNPWMAEEREVFIDKLAAFGKDFKKIASFLDHRTIADCVEFYYKNHKSECFERARKKFDCAKERKSQPNKYLVASGKRGNREANAASLDILGAIAANVDDGVQTQQKCTPRILLGSSSAYKARPRSDDGPLQRSNSLDMSSSETVAADVLAGICGTLSSEAMSSCITTSVDPTEGYHDWRSQRVGSYTKRPLTPDVTQSIDDEYSDESCGEMDFTDWTDHEKSIFINAVSSYGKDFVMISRRVGTRSRDQCKVFFSKTRKCLGLDRILPGASNGDCNGGGDSDIEDACVVETGSGSVTSNDDPGCKVEEDLSSLDMKKLSNESDHNLKPDFKICEENNGPCPRDAVLAEPVLENSLSNDTHVDDKPVIDFNVVSKERNGACVSAQELETMVVSPHIESVQAVEDEIDKSPPNGSNEAENNASVDVSGELCRVMNGQGFVNRKVEDIDVSSSEVSKRESELQPAGNVSHSSPQVDNVSAEKSSAVSLGQNGLLASMESSTLFSVPIKYQEHSTSNGLLSNGINDKQPQKIVMTGDRLSGHSLSDLVESSQILRGYPVSVQTVKEINSDVNYKKAVPLNVPKRDTSLQSNRHPEFFLQKCNGSGHQTRVAEAFPFQEQKMEHSRTQSGCSSDTTDRPSRNGDVKLFGKILVSSSHQKPNSCDDNKVNLDSSKLKFDYNNYVGPENIPVRNSGFWDGNRSQPGFASLPLDPSMLTKFPSVFSSNPAPAVKLVQPFTIDMKQQHAQDVLYSEMQRRNVVSALQQQGRINVVGGVLVGGQCSGGVSDPVAAIKMHYAKAENFSVQMTEDDKWRSNGDLGR